MTKCDHFEWLDEYVRRIGFTGQASIPINGVATRELNLPDSVAPTVGEVGDLKGELKKMNKNLRQLTELKKQSNLIALGFYFCVIALGFAYLLVVSR